MGIPEHPQQKADLAISAGPGLAIKKLGGDTDGNPGETNPMNGGNR